MKALKRSVGRFVTTMTWLCVVFYRLAQDLTMLPGRGAWITAPAKQASNRLPCMYFIQISGYNAPSVRAVCFCSIHYQ